MRGTWKYVIDYGLVRRGVACNSRGIAKASEIIFYLASGRCEQRPDAALCTGNSARSQMAEGLLRHEAADRFEVKSAGTKLGHVRPEAITVMKELGIDISGHRSKHVDEFKGQSFDYVLTVCDNANESCPMFPGPSKRIHKAFEDPAAFRGLTMNQPKTKSAER